MDGEASGDCAVGWVVGEVGLGGADGEGIRGGESDGGEQEEGGDVEMAALASVRGDSGKVDCGRGGRSGTG